MVWYLKAEFLPQLWNINLIKYPILMEEEIKIDMKIALPFQKESRTWKAIVGIPQF